MHSPIPGSRMRRKLAGGHGCGKALRHALAFAAEIRVRCVMCKEPAYRVAMDLGLEAPQVVGVSKVVKHQMYSPERLALIAMRDPGYDDADIAEIFGRSQRWASIVRERADELREAEPISCWLEYLDEGLQPGDPTPAEIAERTSDLHATGQFRGRK